jgi:hypothetical protein
MTFSQQFIFAGNFASYQAHNLSDVVPQFIQSDGAGELAEQLLQLRPEKRISAKNALSHKYFSDLGSGVQRLQPEASIFSLPDIKLHEGKLTLTPPMSPMHSSQVDRPL